MPKTWTADDVSSWCLATGKDAAHFYLEHGWCEGCNRDQAGLQVVEVLIKAASRFMKDRTSQRCLCPRCRTKEGLGPRQYTNNEVHDMFLDYVCEIVRRQEMEHKGRHTPVRECLEGLAFSILVALDGNSLDLPGFIVSPNPHASDEEFLKGEGQNWFPRGVDIAGQLHDHFYDRLKKFDEAGK